MYISTCGYNLYENNDIIDSTNRGFYFYSSVTGGKLVGNTIDGSSSYGILLDVNVDSIVFRENTIKNSGTSGVYIESSDCENNIFTRNSFLQNLKHVLDDSTNNNYNNSVIGNYWDNYTGVDANDDGIGDTPHLVQTGNILYDYLPIWQDGYDIPIPIHVDNNWTATVDAFDWVSGSGTWVDPYIIEDIDIDGSNEKSGIFIENTNEYFIIRNCTIYNTPIEYNVEEGLYDAGITIKQADNGIIYNNTIYDNRYGAINLQYADNHTIFENHLYQNTIVFDQYLWGIYNFWCSYNKIINNTISANAGVIGFNYCNNMTLRDNTMERSGFFFRANSLQQANTHFIPQSNTIDGKILYYYKNQQHLSSTDFQNAWQIILANCHNSSITNLEFTNPNAYRSIDFHYSDDNIIQDCNFTDVASGNEYIYLDNCDNTTIQYNRFYNEDSIYLEDSSYNTIRYNEFTSTDLSILLYDHSNYNKIHNNELNGGQYAVFISYYCSNNEVYENNISDMSVDGIRLWRYNTLNQIYQNNITDCVGNGIHIFTDCHSNIIQDNRITSNTVGIYIEPGCTMHSIYNNFFELNSLHAEDDGNSNIWNSSTIGNYWDNYSGSDLNDDQIGDTPHPIEGNAMAFDYLPIYDDGDSIGPIITVTSPSMSSYHAETPTIDLTITDPSGVHETWYTIIGSGSDHTFTGSSFIVNMTSWMNENDGSVIIRVYGNDTLGNLGYSDISVYKDTIAPVIVINDPNDESTFSNAPEFEINIIEINLDTVWYTMDGSDFIITVFTGTFDITTWNALPDGVINITFYAEDLARNNGTAQITLIKDTSTPVSPGIPGFDLSIILLLSSLLSLVIIIKRKRVKN
jgi:parallel beta-helix repeat protein